MTLPLSLLVPRLPPRLPLGRFPSPLEDHPALATRLGLEQLLVKREDLNGSPFGGNKLRALEWLLPGCGAALVTMGGFGSTWCAALSLAAAQTGRAAYPALFPQPWTPAVAGALATTIAAGNPRLAASRWRLPGALLAAWRAARARGRVTWLPAGGATPLAVLGTVNAALEFAAQHDGLGAARPEAIVVPLGSGGTAAGLVLGLGLARWKIEVCAVRVTDPWYATRARVMSLVERTRRLLVALGCRMETGPVALTVVTGQLGGGYGHPTPAAEAARALADTAGLTLELTYGAKAWAALLPGAHSFRRVCYWHTFDRRLAPVPSSEHPLLEQARGHAEAIWPLPK